MGYRSDQLYHASQGNQTVLRRVSSYAFDAGDLHAPKRACVPETGQEGLESAKSKVGHDGERQRCQRREDQIGIVDGRGSGLAQPQRSWRRAIAGGILQVVLYALMNEGQWISAMIRYMRYSQVEDLRQGVEMA